MQQSAIVFVHGLLGFARLGQWGMNLCYFRGLCDRFGPNVYFPTVPGHASIETRAGVLAGFLDALPHPEITLIGHSMGGLDARYLIHHLDPARRIKRLVTIATPHRGSRIADWAIEGRHPITAAIRGITRPALDELSVARCAHFNAAIPDRADVRYWSYSGGRPVAQLPFWLKPWGRMLGKKEGANDGLVSVESARWGDFRGQLDANHFELAGWRVLPLGCHGAAPFDHVAFYEGLVEELQKLVV